MMHVQYISPYTFASAIISMRQRHYINGYAYCDIMNILLIDGTVVSTHKGIAMKST